MNVASAEPPAQPADPVFGYHAAIDRGQATQGIPFFTADADVQMRGERLRGRSEILRFLSDREAQVDRHTVHVLTNVVTSASAGASGAAPGDRAATVSAVILLYVRDGGGRYEISRVLHSAHEVVDRGHGWQVHRRSAHPLHPSLDLARPTVIT